MSYANGDKYEGQWRADRKHKMGTMTYNNGDQYTGEWKNDARDGNGKSSCEV